MLKVCFITTWMQECGIAEYTAVLAGETLIEASVITEVGIQRPKSKDTAIPAYAVWHRNHFCTPILATLKKINPDIVHIQHEFGLFPNTLELNTLIDSIQVPVVVTLHTIPKNKPVFLSKKATYIAHTFGGYGTLLRQGYKAELIPHWIKRATKYGESLAKPIDLPQDKPLFLTQGFINEGKAQYETVQAFLEANVDASLVIAGLARDINYLQKLMWLVDSSGHPNIKIDPRYLSLEQRDELYRQADVVVLNAKRDTDYSASGQLTSAIGYGKPILARFVEIFKEPLGSGVYHFNSQQDLVECFKNLTPFSTRIALPVAIPDSSHIISVSLAHAELYGELHDNQS